MPTFDGTTLVITLDSGITAVNVADDLYKEWKLWQLAGNMRYPAAFSTEGGQATTATGTVSAFYFLRNDVGWRIRPPEEDIEIFLEGNLYGTDPALPIRVMTIGNFNVLVAIDRDASSVVETVVSGSGVTAQDKTDIIDGVWAKALESGLTAEEITRIMLAALSGKTTGIGTTNEKYKSVDALKDRIDATFDVDSNRTTVILDGS